MTPGIAMGGGGAASSNVDRGNGIFVPPGWGANWLAKYAAAGAGLARIGYIGGSIEQGILTSNLETKPYPMIINAALQAAKGDGGSGFRPPGNSNLGYTAYGISAGAKGVYAANSANGGVAGHDYTPTAGTWTYVEGKTSGHAGPSDCVLRSTVNASIMSRRVRGRFIDIVIIGDSTSTQAAWQWQVDGGGFNSVAALATNTGLITTIDTGVVGNHLVEIKHNDTAGRQLLLGGISARNATGVITHILGHYASEAYEFSLNPSDIATNVDIRRWNGGDQWPLDLAIFQIGHNDITFNGGGTNNLLNYAGELEQMMDNVRNFGTWNGGSNQYQDGSGNGACDIILVTPHQGRADSTALPGWMRFAGMCRDLAENFNAAHVNFSAIGRNSWNYWNSLSYWSVDSASVGSAGTDGVHPSDAGHAFMAATLLPIIQSG